jgi:hypothetical protein
MRFIWVFSHGAMMKKSNNSLTKDDILTFWNKLACCTSNLSKGLQEQCYKFEELTIVLIK